MKMHEPDGGRIEVDGLWQVLRELELGELDCHQRDELMDLLDRSPAAQRAYLHYFELSALLETEAATCAEQGKLPLVEWSGFAPRIFMRSLLAAAALLTVAAVSAALFVVGKPGPARLLVHATSGAIWRVTGKVPASSEGDGEVIAGSTVRVTSGTLELRFKSGPSMVLQGPATVSFPDLHKPFLHGGWLWIDSERVDESFEVHTPELLVRDVGTRFGVKVPKEGPAEVHLVDGKVDVFSRATKKMLSSLEPNESGVVIPAWGDQTFTSLARDPFPEIAELLATPAGYAGTVRSQSPVGYWRMDEEKPGFLANEISGGLIGRRHPDVPGGRQGPVPDSGFDGFARDNRAVLIRAIEEGPPISLGAVPDHRGVMFREDFKGGGGLLNGSTPDVTFGNNKWLASPVFGQDGSVASGVGSATVAFTPVDGVVYRLDATVTITSGPNESWVGIGFGSKQQNDSPRFNMRGLFGRAWMLHRAADTTKPVNRAWLDANASDWIWPSGSPLGGSMNMRIVLDTTKGAGAWTATWYAKRPTDETYTMVRATEPLINESISSAGFSIIGKRLSASIQDFSLSAEPRQGTRPVGVLADGPAQVSQRKGAISFWVRREPGHDREEVLWAAGEGMSGDMMHAHLNADGCVGFFMENGRYDVLIASEKTISDGRWHHLAASWNAESVELYIDGSLAAMDNEPRGFQQGVLSDLSFGGAAKDSRFEPFSGWIDEIALWDRSLTAAEVRHQFQSATGSR